jgi:hypothetical protein
MIRKISSPVVVIAFLSMTAPEAAAQTLRGSPASVNRIHRAAVNHGLTFFPSAAAIRDAHSRGELRRLDGNADYSLADVSFPFVVPATETFVLRLAAQYRQACG